VTSEREELSGRPVHLGRRRDRDEPDEQDQRDGYVRHAVVAVGPSRPRRPPRWIWVALSMVLVVGGLAWYADHRAREHEAAGLAVCQDQLEQASALSDVRLGAMANYLRPALFEASGPRQLHLADLMSGPARRLLPGAQRADRVCRAVSVNPWHFTLVARRNAVTAYSGALVTLLQTVAAQGRAYFFDDVALIRLRRAAGVTAGPG
jgi:hypothetical protein